MIAVRARGAVRGRAAREWRGCGVLRHTYAGHLRIDAAAIRHCRRAMSRLRHYYYHTIRPRLMLASRHVFAADIASRCLMPPMSLAPRITLLPDAFMPRRRSAMLRH